MKRAVFGSIAPLDEANWARIRIVKHALTWTKTEGIAVWIGGSIAGVVIFCCFLASLWILMRQEPPSLDEPALPEPEIGGLYHENVERPIDGGEFRAD